MKYLISHQIRVLASCLNNYKEVWDIVPVILRFSFKNSKLSMDQLKAKGRLNNYESFFSRIKGDLKSAQKDGVIFKRPHELFKMADSLLDYYNRIDNNSEKPVKGSENELLNIIEILYDKNLSLLKKKLSGEILEIMDDIVKVMDTFPFKIVQWIKKEKHLKKELKEDKLLRQDEIKKELQKGPSRTAKREIKVFLDMDGCLTNFDKAVKKLGPKAAKGLIDGASEEERQFMYDKMENKGSRFWSEMEWHPKGEELWKVVKKYKPTLLSSPGKFKWAPAGKEDWVNANLPGVSLFLDEDKYEYVEMDSVLIDDTNNNISAWEEAGGIGILYEEDPESVKEKLKEIVRQP